MKTTKKQTAVEWLISAISFDNDGKKEFVYNDSYDLSKLFNKAKEMEKQHIIDAYRKGFISDDIKLASDYYNETYEI